MITVIAMFKKSVGIAEILRQAQKIIKIIGTIAHQLILKLVCKICEVRSILVGSMLPLLPKIQNKINETTKAGMVDHIIFLMWANNSLSATAEERLVESDKGDILSPKTAPEIIAPATKAGLRFILVPIPKSAIPTVEIVVKPLPIAIPIIEQTIKTDGTKKLPLIKWKPRTMMEGMIPALIQIPIKAPIKIKIKIGIMATLIPSLMPS